VAEHSTSVSARTVAEDVAGTERAEHLCAGAAADADLDRSRDDEESGLAGLTLGEDRVSGAERDGLQRSDPRGSRFRRDYAISAALALFAVRGVSGAGG
jgi:hypothetical protein